MTLSANNAKLLQIQCILFIKLNIMYMIKMCTYKGTEEQPRMQANDVDSLKHETYVY